MSGLGDYTVMGPYVPTELVHAEQRYFTRALTPVVRGSCSTELAQAEIYRRAKENLVRVSLDTCIRDKDGEWGASSNTQVHMNARQLRAFAERLLDAAHDLDAYPSAVLMDGDRRAGALVDEAAS